jgi:hypothetical protein
MSGRSLETSVVTLKELATAWTPLMHVLGRAGCLEKNPLGRTCKVDVTNDIDIGVRHPEGRDGLFKELKSFGYEVKKFGSSLITMRYPFEDKFFQVDIMVGDQEWLGWARFGPGPDDGSKFKGVYRNLLINAILREQSTELTTNAGKFRWRKTIDWDTGMYQTMQSKTGNKGEELKHWKAVDRTLITNVPRRAVSMMFGGIEGIDWNVPHTFEEIVEFLADYDQSCLARLILSFPAEMREQMKDDPLIEQAVADAREVFNQNLRCP